MNTTGNQRSRLLIKNIGASFIVKGWSAIIVLLMVPLTLKMLGVYNNGVWLTISAILVWIDLMDIGLGNGFRNAVASYIAQDDNEKVRKAVSSTFFMLTAIMLPLLAISCYVIYFCDMYSILGINQQFTSNLNTILICAVSLTCFTFILKSVGNFYMGLQLPAVNNFIICTGQTIGLVMTVIAYICGSRSLLVVVAINTLSPLIVWTLSAIYTFGFKFPQYRPSLSHINLRMSRSLCSTGVQFFILQVCSIILLTSTNVIISKIFSPAEVTPYQITYRYFSIMLVIFNAICLPFWNATTDAYTRGDLEWIHYTAHKLNLLVGTIGGCLILMLAVSSLAYMIWVGDSVMIPFELSASMALYIFILIASMRYSFILNGINVLNIQLYYTIGAAITFIPLSIMASSLFGTITSLVMVMCIVNIPGLIANIWKYRQIFSQKHGEQET